MTEMDPFREFDEPSPEDKCIPLGDGSFLVSMEGVPPVPWRTGFENYFATQREVMDLYAVYWDVDKQTGLSRLAEIIALFKTEHAQELEEAALATELDGSSRTWPVVEEVEVLEDLLSRWTALAND